MFINRLKFVNKNYLIFTNNNNNNTIKSCAALIRQQQHKQRQPLPILSIHPNNNNCDTVYFSTNSKQWDTIPGNETSPADESSSSSSSSSMVTVKSINNKLPSTKPDWNRVVSEAEKIVGYPTSFLSLRWLLSDEIAYVALHLRKLIGSTHPLLKTAKHLFYNGKGNMQAWGLIVLLISKAAGHSPNVPDMEYDKSAGILHKQRALAEITEMIRIAYLVHQGLVNLEPLMKSGLDETMKNDMTFGNKISLLSGDYLLGTSSAEIAALRNQDVNELISSALRDLTESEFIGDRDLQNNPLPSRPRLTYMDNEPDLNLFDFDVLKPYPKDKYLGIPEYEWIIRHTLSGGSLLGKSCQGALRLAGLSTEIQRQGYDFGKHLSLAWRASIDLEQFKNSDISNMSNNSCRFSLISAPVLFHLQYDPSLYEEIKRGRESIENINYLKIYKAVISGPGIVKTRTLLEKHSNAAMKYLNKFPVNDARTALQNILIAV